MGDNLFNLDNLMAGMGIHERETPFELRERLERERREEARREFITNSRDTIRDKFLFDNIPDRFRQHITRLSDDEKDKIMESRSKAAHLFGMDERAVNNLLNYAKEQRKTEMQEHYQDERALLAFNNNLDFFVDNHTPDPDTGFTRYEQLAYDAADQRRLTAAQYLMRAKNHQKLTSDRPLPPEAYGYSDNVFNQMGY
jgi:hypothetical protein